MGHGAAVRVSALALQDAGLQVDQSLELRVEAGRLIMEPATESLEDLLARMTPENRHTLALEEPADLYEDLLERLENMELNAIADARVADGSKPVNMSLEALTHDSKETVAVRVQNDPAFAQALLDEAITLVINGEAESAKLILLDLVNAAASSRCTRSS